ncbi:MAG: NfeD family protein [Bacteroidales bacterium]|nr:NfeD family protein [Bacteroidales bacterium]
MLFYKIDLKKEVGSTTWVYVNKGIKEAEKLKADAIILHMNTYGGTVLHADSIRTAILNSEIPFYAFIDNNAASAGALIAIACDSIYMRSGASIGAATVVNQTGEQMPDKYQSYMRATIRSTAEAKGRDTIIVDGRQEIVWRRDPLIAEAMVDDRIYIKNLVDSGRVLTLTAQEAVKNGYCDGIFESTDQFIEQRLTNGDYDVISYKPTWIDEILGFLSSPGIQAALIMIIGLGIFQEIKTPGLGVASVIALIAAVLYFAPLYIEGLAANWEIIVFILGFILLMLELFVIPGFGIAGVSGIILIVVALVLALVNNVVFDFEPVSSEEIKKSVMTVVAGLAASFVSILFIISRVGNKGLMKKFALNSEQKVCEGYIAVSTTERNLINREGEAATILRPAGKVAIDNEYFDAVALYGFIEKGTPVKVVKYENAQLYVVKK